MCFSLLRNRRTVQTVKLTLHHRPKPKSATYRRPFAETNQTARISLQILAMSKSNPEDKQPDQCALNYRRARPDIPLNYPTSRPTRPKPVNPSVVPTSASAAPVRGLLRLLSRLRKQKNTQITDFLRRPQQTLNFRSTCLFLRPLPEPTFAGFAGSFTS